ncbi:prepilin-type N-terminal cleavage/methylation domain-containing protein [Propionivibrio sp.]|uniref:type IV pilus modification PilV family protein n=1 Tax=Propionivibrio sp. TaxID=2212460 RepID=UPI002631245C|nr:prepilin-type N-terminal cleavage/methylation domain-containing protein [Propionivibrio sp.]
MYIRTTRFQAGFTLLELIIAMVIISVGVTGVLAALDTSVKASADPLVSKQMLAVAEELLEETLLRPYAVVGVAPVNAPASCGGFSPPARTTFDDVSDYHNYETTGICDIDGAAVAGLAAYGVKVTVVANGAIATDLTGLPAGAVKKITVLVTHGSQSLSLIGWRSDYAS